LPAEEAEISFSEVDDKENLGVNCGGIGSYANEIDRCVCVCLLRVCVCVYVRVYVRVRVYIVYILYTMIFKIVCLYVCHRCA